MPAKTSRYFAALTSAAMLTLSMSGFAYAGGGGGGGGVSTNTAPSQRPTIDVAEVYRSGVQKYEAGDFKAAEKDLRKVTREARTNPNGHYMLGLSRMGQEKWKSAASAFKKAVRYNENMHEARAQLGLAYVKQDKLEKAAEQMADLEARLAECGEACGPKLKKAVEDLRTAMNPAASSEEVASLYRPIPVKVSSEAGDAAYLEAVRLINIGDFDTALEQLHTSETVFGPHPDVLTYIGFANRKAGNYDQAILYYTSALSLSPDHVGANEYLGEYYVELGDMDAARAQLAKLEEICTFGCAEADELRSWIIRAEAS